jgi:hypothetical protein
MKAELLQTRIAPGGRVGWVSKGISYQGKILARPRGGVVSVRVDMEEGRHVPEYDDKIEAEEIRTVHAPPGGVVTAETEKEDHGG